MGAKASTARVETRAFGLEFLGEFERRSRNGNAPDARRELSNAD